MSIWGDAQFHRGVTCRPPPTYISVFRYPSSTRSTTNRARKSPFHMHLQPW
jgi:hypothetical protein